MDHYDEVLDAVQALRPQMAALPEKSGAEESLQPWNVREATLDTDLSATVGLERWEDALALNAEIVQDKEAAQGQRAGISPHPLQRLRLSAESGPIR